MSHEGGGMKMRDLARGSSSPTGFMPAFHIFRSRFRNRGTSGRSRKSYESVPRSSSSALCFLTLLQQTTMVPVLGILRPPCRLGSPVAIPIRTHRRDRNFYKCTCHKPTSLYFLIFEQNQGGVYHEVLIAGDVSEADINQATTLRSTFLPYGGTSDTAEFVYDNDTVYFAQPTLSQFVPGGSGAGTFNLSASIGLKDTPNNTIALMGRNAPKSHTGVVLRCALPAR